MIGNVGHCVLMSLGQLLSNRDPEMHRRLESLALYQSLKISFTRSRSAKIHNAVPGTLCERGRPSHPITPCSGETLPLAMAKIVLFVIMNPPPET